MDHTTLVIVIGAIVVVLLLAVLLLRARRQHVALSNLAPPPPRAAPAPPPLAEAPAPIVHPDEQAVVLTAAAVGNAPIETLAAAEAPAIGDPLTRIKGLGPKAAARLAELGVTRFDQIAGWSDAEAARIDAALGPFRGRIERDRWIEQARLLAAGDRAAFEEQFGKLGG